MIGIYLSGTGNTKHCAEKIDVPVLFIVGKYDCTCCASLQQARHDLIAAPQKGILVFEKSAHSPIYEGYDEGKRVLAEIKRRVQ